MVRGDARDLTIPEPESEAFEFLARRVGYGDNPLRLRHELEETSRQVLDLGRLLDRPADAK
jgi:glutamate-ammonia-ligase adenylyltransferase